MKTLIRISEAFLKLLAWFILAIVVWSLTSCSRVNYYPVESYKTDSVYIKLFERDSVYFRDSVFVHTKADTVFFNRIQYKYCEMVIRDTVRFIQCDTTTTVREVPREFTKLQILKMNIGTGVMWAIPIILFLYILYRKLKK